MENGSCPTEEELNAFQLGNLPEASIAAVTQHLEHCLRCETVAQALDTAADPILNAIRSPVGGPISQGPTRLLAPGTPAPGGAGGSSRWAFLLPPQEADEIGRLGHYRVLRLLGQGGMAYVFQAEDTALNRAVALKVMKPELLADADGGPRFLREARMMAAIKHEHLIPIYQAGQEGSVFYLAMELLQGETLGAWLNRNGPASAAEVLRLGQQIADGLAIIHRRGLIHRDIKLDNIWLEAPAGTVKILDFGLARFVNDNTRFTQVGTVMGTPAFMSPEQARGDDVDARSDLFSLGVVLYCLCTGKNPFHGEHTMAILTALAVGTPPPVHEIVPALPRSLSKLIMRLLAKDPAERPASVEDVRDRLQKIETAPRRGVFHPGRLLARCTDTFGSALAMLRRHRHITLGIGLLGVPVLAVLVWLVLPKLYGDREDSGSEALEVTWPAANETGTYLSELGHYAETNWIPGKPAPPRGKWNEPKRDFEPIAVEWKGQFFSHGIFMHAPTPDRRSTTASLSYRLDRKYRMFYALVSLNDGAWEGSETPITFSVQCDGKRLWESAPVFQQHDTQRVAINVKGKEKLTIAIEIPLGKDVRGAHAIWIDPYLAK
jgi:eukaryotic-like serine/threonine-protein kinase